MSNAIKIQEVASNQDLTQKDPLVVVDRHAKHSLGDGVEIKVADSDKCISIYGITGRMPINFTREAAQLFFDKVDQMREYFEHTQNNLLSRDERKYTNTVTKIDAKLNKAAADLAQKQRAVALMKANKGMDWDSAMALSAQE